MPSRADLSKIKAVCFDLDGVLIESYSVWYLLFNDALKYFGFQPITERTFRKHWGQSTEEDVRIFMPGRTVDEVRSYFQTHFHDYLTDIKVDPLAHRTLQALRRLDMALACLTNSHRDITEQILMTHQLDKYFNVVITADDVDKPKPAPDMLLSACEYLKVRPDQILFVGDTQSDKEAGISAGCLFVGYRLNADIIINSLKDLCDFFQT